MVMGREGLKIVGWNESLESQKHNSPKKDITVDYMD
jgi:hypothetical protein